MNAFWHYPKDFWSDTAHMRVSHGVGVPGEVSAAPYHANNPAM